MSKGELIALKAFIEQNIPFDALKQTGFFQKGTRRTHYEIIAKRVCTFFGFKSIYEYQRPHILHKTPIQVNGKFPDQVDTKGNIVAGGGFHLDVVETEFTCPICTCEQDATEHKAYNKPKALPVLVIKCKGCKRQLTLCTDIGGNLTVTEKSNVA